MAKFWRMATAVVFAALIGGNAAANDAQQLGTVSFANSCSEAVQPYLQRAVALLHSFWWEEADAALAITILSANTLRKPPRAG